MYDADGVNTNEYNVIKVNVNDFSGFDVEAESKVVPLLTDGLSLHDAVGFGMDKLGNYYCAFNHSENGEYGSKVFLIDKSNGTLKEEFTTGEIYSLEYDDKSNSLFCVVYDEDSGDVRFVQYDLSSRTKVRNEVLNHAAGIIGMRVMK